MGELNPEILHVKLVDQNFLNSVRLAENVSEGHFRDEASIAGIVGSNHLLEVLAVLNFIFAEAKLDRFEFEQTIQIVLLTILSEQDMGIESRFLPMHSVGSVPKVPLAAPDVFWDNGLPIVISVERIDLKCSIVGTSLIHILDDKRHAAEHTNFGDLSSHHFLQHLVIGLLDFLLLNHIIFILNLYLLLVVVYHFLNQFVQKLSFLFMLRQSRHELLDLLELPRQGTVVGII